MKTKQSYKDTETDRYNKRAKQVFDHYGYYSNKYWGFETLNPILQPPYKFYQNVILQSLTEKSKVIDLCCGDGIFSFIGCLKGAEVTVTDIAKMNVVLTTERAKLFGYDIKGYVADLDEADLPSNTYDAITCAGSLSYLNLNKVLPKIASALTQNGTFFVVDSLDHNPIYKLNRFFHYLRGNRTFHVNQNIPTLQTIKLFRKYFKNVEVNYFGIFTFASTLMNLFIKPETTSIIIEKLDRRFYFLNKYAFKIVIIAKN